MKRTSPPGQNMKFYLTTVCKSCAYWPHFAGKVTIYIHS